MESTPNVHALRRRVELLKELLLRRADPLLKAYDGLTPRQKAFVGATQREKVAEGGNQSGKSWSTCIDFCLGLAGKHPTRKRRGAGAWRGWYSTTTYDRFAEQAWGHFKALLLFPGESVHKLPTRRILNIGWDARYPETPTYLKVLQDDGEIAEAWIKSFKQGREEFQAAEVDVLAIDEECPTEIYEEAQPRLLKRNGQIVVAATPVTGVKWLQDLRDSAESDRKHIFHTRFPTYENPGLTAEAIAGMMAKCKARPDLFKLRMEGHPVVDEGRIYPDSIWNPEGGGRIVAPFSIPHDWTRFRSIDHGVHTVAALWAAVAPGSKKIVVYREYYGRDVTPAVEGNALNILRLSLLDGGEKRYAARWIDPATLGSGQETGERLIDIWNRSGYCIRCENTEASARDPRRCAACGSERVTIDVDPAPDNRVESGIEKVRELLLERAPDGSPLLVFFDNLANLFAERREYGRHEPDPDKGDADDRKRKPIKRNDHLLDNLRYLIAAGLAWKPPAAPPPPDGSLARKMWEKRKENAARARGEAD